LNLCSEESEAGKWNCQEDIKNTGSSRAKFIRILMRYVARNEEAESSFRKNSTIWIQRSTYGYKGTTFHGNNAWKKREGGSALVASPQDIPQRSLGKFGETRNPASSWSRAINYLRPKIEIRRELKVNLKFIVAAARGQAEFTTQSDVAIPERDLR